MLNWFIILRIVVIPAPSKFLLAVVSQLLNHLPSQFSMINHPIILTTRIKRDIQNHPIQPMFAAVSENLFDLMLNAES